MSQVCKHHMIVGRCPRCDDEVAAVPLLNLDRFGMPKDYATYVWVLYGLHVTDESPGRLAFLHRPSDIPTNFGLQWSMR